jgi:hypothetical protein
MTRRFAATFTLLMTLTGLLAMPVAAKELAVAVRLETAIPPDLKPGDTIKVAFRMTVTTPDGEGPYDADPISVRVSGPSDAAVDVLAVHDGSGHYTAAITVPASGIARIAAILPSDGPQPLSWDMYAAPPIVGTPADPATAPSATTPAIADGLVPVIALGVGAALVAAAAVVAVDRRRKALPAGTGRT